MELFEQIRREFELGVRTIAGESRKFGVHRRILFWPLGNEQCLLLVGASREQKMSCSA